jgi:hypothetical protein
MIKKLLFSAAFLMAIGTKGLVAQNCTPDPQYPQTSHGIHPDSATNFVQGYANQPYSQLITIVVPQDTTPPFPPVPIPWDSTVLLNITGLPNGFTYACWNSSTSPSRCAWRGNTTGCAIIAGNPTLADTGTYNLTVNTNNYLGGSTSPIPYTITYYKIKINGPLSVPVVTPNKFMVNDCSPNPFSDKTEIIFNSPEVKGVSFKVYNVVGTEVYSVAMRAQRGTNKFVFERNALPAGMYVFSVSNGDVTITRRMVISK